MGCRHHSFQRPIPPRRAQTGSPRHREVHHVAVQEVTPLVAPVVAGVAFEAARAMAGEAAEATERSLRLLLHTPLILLHTIVHALE